MSHYFETGFAVRRPSWHAKETLLAVAPDLSNWRQAAGLEWEPVKVPLYLPAPLVALQGADGLPLYGEAQPSGTYALVRNDRIDGLYSNDPQVRDRAVLCPGVSEGYVEVQHERDMTPLIEALGQAADAMGIGWEITTAGSVREGKQVYVCIQLDRPIELPGDESLTLPFGVVLNGHGAGACRGGLTAVRVVCANTYAMADADMDGHRLDFRLQHTGDVQGRLEEARQAIAGWLDAIESYRAMAVHLCSLPVDDDVVTEWVSEFLPVDEIRMTDRQIDNRRSEQAIFRAVHEGSPTTDGIRGTAFGLWQTSIEFMDHIRPHRTADSYLSRTMLEPADSKLLARQRIVELCESGAS